MNELVERKTIGSGSGPTTALVPAEPVQVPEPDEISPLVKAHYLLKGRYKWAILLSMVLMAGLGYLGWWSVVFQYRTTGAIEIKPYQPKILYSTENSTVMPMFDAFVNSQVQYIQRARVLDLAMESPQWRKLGRDNNSQSQSGGTTELAMQSKADFRESLTVSRARHSQIITVSFVDRDIEATQIAVKSVLNAYMRLYGESDIQRNRQRMEILEGRRTTLTRSLQEARGKILKIAFDVGSDSLDSLYQFKLENLNKLEEALKQNQMMLADAGEMADENGEKANGNGTGTNGVSGMDVEPELEDIPPDQIARIDRKMAEYIAHRDSLELEGAMLLDKYGKNHPKVKSIKQIYGQVNNQIRTYAAMINQMRRDGQFESNADPTSPDGTVNVALLKKRIKRLKEMHKQQKLETLELGQKNLEIKQLKEEASEIATKLDVTKNRIEELNMESADKGRIELVSDGDTEPTPVNRGKRKQLAVLGGFSGFCMGFGLMMILGFLDKKIKSSTDTKMGFGGMRLLGVLPKLPENMEDPEVASVAGFCVHHIRTLLQLGMGSKQGQSIVITSPASGSGKTSLTFALGISFAGTGAKTLLIDSDITGGGLTRRLGSIVKRRIGQILIQEGKITAEQLNSALTEADSTDKKLGEVLVDSGVLRSDDVEQALAMQMQATIGLLDALANETIDGCCMETDIEGMEILPIGGAIAEDAHRISPVAFARILEEAHQRYDVVLIDTGPVPGSLEMSVAASEADRVVMVVSRGEQKPDVDRALHFLEMIGARVEGLVFNRADTPDWEKSVHSTSMMSRRPEGDNGHDDVYGSGHEEQKRMAVIDAITGMKKRKS